VGEVIGGDDAMNGAGVRSQRSTATLPVELAPLPEFAREAGVSQQSRAPGRGQSLAHGPHVQIAYAAIDTGLVYLGGTLIFCLRFQIPHSIAQLRHLLQETAGHKYVGFFLLYAALVVLACVTQDLYRTPRDRAFLDETLRVAKATGIATVLLVLFIFISGYKDMSRLVVILTGAQSFFSLSGWRYLKRKIVMRRTLRGIGISRVLVVGFGKMGRSLASWFDANPHLGYTVCGFLDTHRNGDAEVLGTVRDLRSVALAHFVDELFVTLPADGELVKETFLEARRLGLNLHVVPDIYDGLGWSAALHMIGGFTVMDLLEHPIPALGLALKRVGDVLGASIGLILAAPVLALAALWIRLDSPGPAFYTAQRVGWKGRKFRCYKLRTMVIQADQQKNELRSMNERKGPFFKMKNDPRITRCGRWLRKFSFDELPQLWNVLIGNMSLVGPRPHPVDDFERYELEDLRRLDVKPGMTGLWQVKARHDPSFATNVALDLEYIENWNLLLDVRILLSTVPAILRAEGR
jgi:exopolysaccharide biosynthesis polyprenyl glycosylphosphotransferase